MFVSQHADHGRRGATVEAVRTREAVKELLAAGLNRTQIAARLGITKSTVSYHARRLGEPVDVRANRRYDWAEVQSYYDRGHSIAKCQERFGMARKTFADAVRRGAIKTRPQAMSIEELLAARRNRSHVKQRLVSAGLLELRCQGCGIDSWRGAQLSLELHHVNGDGADNRLENLRMLCPNCHSQTPTWGGRNRGRPSVRPEAEAA
jgi:transposase